MRVKFDLLNDVRADERVRAFGYGESAVSGATNFIEVREFVDVLAALETEMLKQIERCSLGDNRHGEFFCLGNDVMRVVRLVHGDRNSVLRDRRGSHLRHGVDNAGVIFRTVIRAQNEQAVLNIKQNFAVH